jgi:aminopeptidase N
VKISGQYNASAQEYTLDCHQSFNGEKFKKNQPAHIPIKVKLLQANGTASEEQTISLLKAQESFTFRNVEQRPIPSLLREFSSPIILDFEYTDEELLYLLAHDDDAFNRWEAGQHLQNRLMLTAIPLIEKNLEPIWNAKFIEALSTVLKDVNNDPALTAELFSTPAESHLAESCVSVNPDLIHAARNALRAEIAVALETQLLQVYVDQSNNGAYSPDAKSAGHRSIKNVCLGLLVETQKDEYIDLCLRQYETATNMTDEYAALQSIVHTERTERETVLKNFHNKWKSEPLALDKWFAVQAGSRARNTAEQVERLINHPSFDIKNPNKAFSLLRTFASNHVHFHRSDGAGYKLISDSVVEIDKINPQVAARIARSFDRWRKFDATRQNHAKLALENIINQPKLSKDTSEVVSKTLKG